MFSKVASFLLIVITYSYAQECKDEVKFCHSIARTLTCDLNVAQRRCRKTCNNCTVPAPAKLTPGPGCRDQSKDCEDTFYACGEHPDHPATSRCKQTCEDCACYDVVTFCHLTSKDGRCGMEVAKRNCRATCKHCAVPVPEITEPTETCKDDLPELCEQAFYVCDSNAYYARQCRKTCETCVNGPIVSTTLAPENSTDSQTTSEVITESPEVTPEVSTESPEVTSEVITESPEVTPEVSTESPEVTPEVITESPEVTVVIIPELRGTTEPPKVITEEEEETTPESNKPDEQ